MRRPPQNKRKLKNRPRGRPFAKGNKIGPRFHKGKEWNGNPGGRPRTKMLSDAYRVALELDEKQLLKAPRTNAEAIAHKMVAEARKGKVNAAGEIADRVEGKPRQAYEVKLSIIDELAERVRKARERTAKK